MNIAEKNPKSKLECIAVTGGAMEEKQIPWADLWAGEGSGFR